MTKDVCVREAWTASGILNEMGRDGAKRGPCTGAADTTDRDLNALVDRVTKLLPGAGFSLLEVDESSRSYVSWHTYSIENCDSVELAVLEHFGLKADRRVRLCRVGLGPAAGLASAPRLYNVSFVVRVQSEVDGLQYVMVALLDRPDGRTSLEEELLFSDHAGELVELLGSLKAGAANELQASFGCTATTNAPWGVLAFGATGKVLFSNLWAKQILSRQVGLHIRNGRLQFHRAAAARTFAQVLDSLCNWNGMGALNPVPPSRALSVPGPGGEICYALWLTPQLAGRDRPGAVTVVGYLTDLMEWATAERPLLATLFSLTAKEAHLVELLGSGCNLEQSAGLMGIARNTARIHLSNIFSKTGTRSQVELARLLARLPPTSPAANQGQLQKWKQTDRPRNAGTVVPLLDGQA